MLPVVLLLAACSNPSQSTVTATLPDGTKFILSTDSVKLTEKDGVFTVSDGNVSAVVTDQEIIANGKSIPRPAAGSVVKMDSAGNILVQ